MSAVKFYKGRDNTHDLQLKEAGAIINHALISRVRLELTDGNVIDSNTTPELFTLLEADRITLKLGQSAIPVGGYNARVVVFDASNPNGMVFTSIGFSIVD